MPGPYNNGNNSIHKAYKTGVDRLGVLTTNLQNINTTAYKSVNPDSVLFGEVMEEMFRDKEEGPIVTTREKLDLAITGSEAYFLVEGEEGPERTRDGHFHINETGKIVNHEGKEVVVIDRSDKPMNLHMSEDLEINHNGEILSQGTYIGRIALDYANPVPGEKAYVLQGKLEGSNVSLEDLSTQIMQTKRHIDTLQNMLAMDLSLEKALMEAYGRNV